MEVCASPLSPVSVLNPLPTPPARKRGLKRSSGGDSTPPKSVYLPARPALPASTKRNKQKFTQSKFARPSAARARHALALSAAFAAAADRTGRPFLLPAAACSRTAFDVLMQGQCSARAERAGGGGKAGGAASAAKGRAAKGAPQGGACHVCDKACDAAACSFCARGSCPSCAICCVDCGERFCKLCSTKKYVCGAGARREAAAPELTRPFRPFSASAQLRSGGSGHLHLLQQRPAGVHARQHDPLSISGARGAREGGPRSLRGRGSGGGLCAARAKGCAAPAESVCAMELKLRKERKR